MGQTGFLRTHLAELCSKMKAHLAKPARNLPVLIARSVGQGVSRDGAARFLSHLTTGGSWGAEAGQPAELTNHLIRTRRQTGCATAIATSEITFLSFLFREPELSFLQNFQGQIRPPRSKIRDSV